MNKLNTQQFIERAIKIHGNKYDYNLVNYEKASTKIKIICKVHGEFLQRPNDHLSNKGCVLCGGKSRKTNEDFLRQMLIIHPTITVHETYKSAFLKIKCSCAKCNNIWFPTPDNLINGKKGCPECVDYGFKNNKSAYLYVNKSSDGIIKVGKSNNDPSRRLYLQNRSSGKDFRTVFQIYNESGITISNLELKILQALRAIYKNPIDTWDGYTEMFIDADLLLVLNLIENYSKSESS